jgi:phosphohistidine phosphatase
VDTPDRVLVVVRHAKSDWGTGQPDIERPLNDRGRRDAAAAGRWLRDRGLAVDAAVISPSRRTRQTWALLAEAAQLTVDPAVDRAIYLGSAVDLAGALMAVPTASRCSVLVGHAPGCPDLVEWLTGGQGDSSAVAAMREKFPTAGAAVVGLDGGWSDMTAGAGRLLEFAVCRG